MKPIHKFNNGVGATLCHQCNCIISLGYTEDLYCKRCNKHREELLIELMRLEESIDLYVEQAKSKFIKKKKDAIQAQSAAERLFPDYQQGSFISTQDRQREGFIAGAKWQEQKMYSEKEVLIMISKYIEDNLDPSTHGNIESVKEWFEQFKNK